MHCESWRGALSAELDGE
ncbi:hypothetical protein, partial [Tsukamurella strandjordii]